MSNFSQNDIKYYIPFWRRPMKRVNAKMIEKLDVSETDAVIVKNEKRQLRLILARSYYGSFIVKHSPHLYSGIVTRGAFYMGIMALFLQSESFVFLGCPLFLCIYGWYASCCVYSAHLHSAFCVLTK